MWHIQSGYLLAFKLPSCDSPVWQHEAGVQRNREARGEGKKAWAVGRDSWPTSLSLQLHIAVPTTQLWWWFQSWWLGLGRIFPKPTPGPTMAAPVIQLAFPILGKRLRSNRTRPGRECASIHSSLSREMFQTDTLKISLPEEACFPWEKLNEHLFTCSFYWENSNSISRNVRPVHGHWFVYID